MRNLRVGKSSDLPGFCKKIGDYLLDTGLGKWHNPAMKKKGQNQLVLRGLGFFGFSSSRSIWARAFFGKRCAASSLSLSL